MERVFLVLSLLYVTLFVHAAPLLESVVTEAGGRTPVKSVPVIVSADGLPLGVSLSEARDVVALDGHVFIALPAADNDTLLLKITALKGLLDTSFVSSHVIGEQLLVGSTSDCVYQVTVIGDTQGKGLVNLCDNLRGYLYTGKLGYSITPAQGGVAHEVTVSTAVLLAMPPLTEAIKAPERMTRAVVKQRYIELLVVADHTTLQWHSDQDVESYILTLISLASRVLKDSSLGQSIELVVKKLVMLEQATRDLKIVSNMALTTKRFTRWKNKYEKQEDESFDLALLLTRMNLKYGSIDHTGHATTGGICQADTNCILVKDGGLTSSYTIAHEIGHSLGLGHDGEGDNDCTDRRYVMSATAYASAQSPLWSSCSRNKLDELLRYEPYQCLHNKPATFSADQKPLLLPGEKYSRDKQCQLRHGPSASSCDIKDQCSMLWCQLPSSSCMTNQMSVADGTPCTMTDGRSSGVCMDRQCTPAVNRTVVDGQWGEWSGWSNCSRTCGVGVAYSERSCDSPKPSNGGRYCTGEKRRYHTCNVQDCPANSNDVNHRDEQCKSHGDKWRALDEGIQLNRNACKLYCEAPSEKVFKVFSAADGTWCKAGSLDMCIAGQCTAVGCDKQLWSNATLDRCGVCNGNGSTCVEKSGTLALSHLGLNRITVVPKGAFKVMVREKESTANYIVAEDNHGMLFNGSNVSMAEEVTKVHFSGLDWEYGRPRNAPEYLMANGPSSDEVTVAMFAEEHCRGIEYSYLAPVDAAEPTIPEQYSWHYTFWSPCSVTCGKGVSTSVARCFNNHEEPVSAKYCKGLPKPKRQKRKCLLRRCPTAVEYNWHYTKWSRCSAACGGGVKTRTVRCMAVGMTARIVDTALCSHKKVPPSSKACNKKPCPYKWVHTDWSNCSVECGMGHMSREVKCNDAQGNVVDDEKCAAETKPAVREQCYRDGIYCKSLIWRYTPWSECSVTCGMGVRMRKAECRYRNGTMADESLCSRYLGPAPPVDNEECITGTNCSTQCKDSDKYLQLCASIRDGNLCHMENVRRECCKTCQEAGFV